MGDQYDRLGDWLDNGAPGGDLHFHVLPTARPYELVEGVQHSPVELARTLHRDERTIRDWVRYSVKAWDGVWEAQLGPGDCLLLHEPETGKPVQLPSGHRVTILSRPPEPAGRGRPKKGQTYVFGLAEPQREMGGFCVPQWISHP